MKAEYRTLKIKHKSGTLRFVPQTKIFWLGMIASWRSLYENNNGTISNNIFLGYDKDFCSVNSPEKAKEIIDKWIDQKDKKRTETIMYYYK
jgi:hypothetical protein